MVSNLLQNADEQSTFCNLTLELNKNLKQFASYMDNLSLYFKNDKDKNLEFSKVK
jgi:hypothetical protein